MVMILNIFPCKNVLKFGYTSIDSVPADLMMGAKPIWSDETQSVYFVDIFGHKICRYGLGDDTVYKATIDNGDYTGFISPIDGHPNRFIVGAGASAAMIDWDGSSPTATRGDTVFDIEPNTNFLTFLAGPDDDYYFGGFNKSFCLSPANLPLYFYTASKGQSVVASNFKAITGLVLFEKYNVMCVLDSCASKIVIFDHDPITGVLCE